MWFEVFKTPRPLTVLVMGLNDTCRQTSDSEHAEYINELLDVLRDAERRVLLMELHELNPTEEDPIPIQDLAHYMTQPKASRSSSDEYDRLAISLHHVHIPMMESMDIVNRTDDNEVYLGDESAVIDAMSFLTTVSGEYA